MDTLKSLFGFGSKNPPLRGHEPEGQELEEMTHLAAEALAPNARQAEAAPAPLTGGAVRPLDVAADDPSSQTLEGEMTATAEFAEVSFGHSAIAGSGDPSASVTRQDDHFLDPEKMHIEEAIRGLEEQATSRGDAPLEFEEFRHLLPYAITIGYNASKIPFEGLTEEADALAYNCLKMARHLLVEFHASGVLTPEVLIINTLLGNRSAMLDQFDEELSGEVGSSSALVVMQEFYEKQQTYMLAKLGLSAVSPSEEDGSLAFTGVPTRDILNVAIGQRDQIRSVQFRMLTRYMQETNLAGTKDAEVQTDPLYCFYRTLQMYAKIRDNELLFGCDPRTIREETEPSEPIFLKEQGEALFRVAIQSIIGRYINIERDTFTDLNLFTEEMAQVLVDFFTDELSQIETCKLDKLPMYIGKRIDHFNYPRRIGKELPIIAALNAYHTETKRVIEEYREGMAQPTKDLICRAKYIVADNTAYADPALKAKAERILAISTL